MLVLDMVWAPWDLARGYHDSINHIKHVEVLHGRHGCWVQAARPALPPFLALNLLSLCHVSSEA